MSIHDEINKIIKTFTTGPLTTLEHYLREWCYRLERDLENSQVGLNDLARKLYEVQVVELTRKSLDKVPRSIPATRFQMVQIRLEALERRIDDLEALQPD